MSENYAHTARIPNEWPDLLKYTTGVVEGSVIGQRLVPSQVNRVLNEADRLDNRTLEQVRFYGSGEVICAYARHISDPKIEAETITQIAEHLADAHFDTDENDTAGLRVLDVDGVKVREPMIERAQAAKTRVPLDVLLLTDSLYYISLQRRKALMPVCQNILPTFADILNLNVSSESIGTSTLMAASLLIRNDLIDTYCRVRDLPWQKAVQNNPLVNKIRSDKGLTNMRLLRAATYLAKLRSDEALAGEVALASIRRGRNGSLELDNQQIPDNPPPVSNESAMDISTVLLRVDRFGCPAVHCAPMINKVLTMLPQAMLSANKIIKAA